MSNARITELAEHTTPAAGDDMPIVDNSGSPATKRVRVSTLDARYVNTSGDTMTGRLVLPAGTAAANTGPLKFQAGTLLATPEAGSMEFSDGRWYITGTAKQRVIDRTSFNVNVADVTVAATATETTLYSWSLSTNAMKVGRIYKIHVDGVILSAPVKTITFNFYVSGNLYVTSVFTPGNIAVAKPWCGDYEITVRTIGTNGTTSLHRTFCVNSVGTEVCSLQAVNTEQSNTLTLKVQWSDNNAGNSITLQQAYLELKN